MTDVMDKIIFIGISMTCPHCGTKLFTVLDTRQRKDSIRTVRLCFNGHRFVTVEKVLQKDSNG